MTRGYAALLLATFSSNVSGSTEGFHARNHSTTIWIGFQFCNQILDLVYFFTVPIAPLVSVNWAKVAISAQESIFFTPF
jgi:hypothetical protein